MGRIKSSLPLLLCLTAAPAAWAAQGERSGEVEQSLRRMPGLDPTSVRPSAKVEVEPRAEMRSADDSKVRMRVQRFRFTGNHVLPTARLESAVTGAGAAVDREMSLAEIKTEADAVTQLYRTLGYGLAWAYIPAQEVQNGIVEIAVVEGRFDRIFVEGNRYYSADFIFSHVDALQKAEAADLEELNRELMGLNEYPGLRVRATLRQGERPGTTDVFLQAEDKFPINFSVDFDNFGSESVGENRVGAFLETFNLTGDGDSLSFRGVAALDAAEGELAYGRIGYSIPFRAGTRITLYGAIYDYEAKGDVTAFDPTGKGEVFGAVASHPFVRQTNLTFSAEIGLEVKNLEQELLGVQTGEDRLRLLVGGVRLDWTDSYSGRWNASLLVRQGLDDVAGGLEDNDPDASRQGADGEFTRFNLEIYRLQKITDWLHLIGRVHGQYASEPLVVSEQIAIGGHDSVRGYPPFEFMGDRGYTATLEGRVKLPFLADVSDPFQDGRSIVDMVQLAAFLDTGLGERNDPLPAERKLQVLSGAGVGLRLNYPDRLSFRFDVGWPVSSKDPSDDDDQVFYFSIILTLH